MKPTKLINKMDITLADLDRLDAICNELKARLAKAEKQAKKK